MSKSFQRNATHRVYAVERRRSKSASWTDIGLAFTHKDGKGFDLELQSMPLSAAELVVRTAEERIAANGVLVRAAAARRRPPMDIAKGRSKSETADQVCL